MPLLSFSETGKIHPFGDWVIGVETHLIIGIRKPAHDLEGSLLALH